MRAALRAIGHLDEEQKIVSDVVENAETISPTDLLPERLLMKREILVRRPEDPVELARLLRGRSARPLYQPVRLDGITCRNLARALWKKIGRVADAKEPVEQTSSLFIEGFEVSDFVEARELVQEWRSESQE
jgi:hypothetical protein